MKKIRITQTRSLIGQTKKQKATMKALGMNRIRKTVEHEVSPQVMGMIGKVSHLLIIEEV